MTSIAESEPESVTADADADGRLSYRLLDPAEYPLAASFFSFTYPGTTLTFDPLLQRIAAVFDGSTIIAAAVVSSVYQISYAAPLARPFDIRTLQATIETCLAPGDLYYSILPDRDVAAELAMTPYPEAVVAVRIVEAETDAEAAMATVVENADES